MAPTIRIQDIADILIMTFLLYQLYTWFRGTRAIQVLLGLGVVTLIYFATRFLDLYMTSWVLQELGTVLIVLMVVVFQVEIRQALYRFSLLRHILDSRRDSQHSRFQEVAETLFAMASRHTGALLVFQRNDPLDDLVSNGVSLDCEISPQILESIFYNGSPLHDGAALIRGGRIALASCHLPLSVDPEIPQNLGTRHRAALGLSECCDAVIVVISEERGEVSLVSSKQLQVMNSTSELISALDGLLRNDIPAPSVSLRERFFANLLPKAAVLLGVCIFWALVTTRQGQITTVTAPVIFHGVPDGLILLKTAPEEVNVQLKSLSSLSPPPSKIDLTAELDASDVKDGQTNIRIHNSDFNLPAGLSITTISPTTVRITAEKKLRKRVLVKASLKGKLAPAVSSMQVVCEPATVDIEGPYSHISDLESVLTEDIDASLLKKGSEYKKNIRQLPKRVTLLRDLPITIKLVPSPRRR